MDAATEAAILRATAAAYRKAAEWCNVGEAMTLEAVARDVEAFDDARWACCPCCQEVTCDENCPLAPIRNRAPDLPT